MGKKYPVAPNGIYDTVQGEGVLLGEATTFVRLAGCSVGCEGCDTNYSVAERLSVAEVVERVERLPRRGWLSLTGGEPTDHDLGPLLEAVHGDGYSVALWTAGHRAVPHDWRALIDFLAVSPHDPAAWVQQSGDQLNVVPYLKGHSLADIVAAAPKAAKHFNYCYATPHSGKPETLAECLEWVRTHDDWRLGIQAHLHWRLP